MRLSKVTACLVACLFCLPVWATYMTPNDEVPVERLIENLTTYLQKNPNDADALFELGRVYSYAYATGGGKFGVYTKGPYWRPALGGTFTPSRQPTGGGPLETNRLDYLMKGIKHLKASVAIKADRSISWLSLGYICREAAGHADQIEWPYTGSPFDEEAKAKATEKRFWEDQALEALRNAYRLDKSDDRLGDVGEEAAVGIKNILQNRPDATDAEKKEFRRMKRAVSAANAWVKPITPVIFSLDNRPLAQMLDSRRVAFDLDGSRRKLKWEWVRPETALLAWDPRGTGNIRSGRQLFGSVTWWMFWQNGYAALAALDDNANGWLEGAELNGIAAWRDANGNGKSDPGEVTPVRNLQISGINTAISGRTGATPWVQNGIRFTDGRTVATYDWISTGTP